VVVSRLSRGERAPDFVLPCGGTATRFYGCAGGAPTVLIFHPIRAEDISVTLEALTEWTTFVIARREPKTELGVRVFIDADGTVSAVYGVPEGKGRVVVLDPALRVIRTVDTEAQNATALAAAVLDAISKLPRVEPRVVPAQAPVLLVPRVLEPKVCEQLGEVWRTCGNEETGVETSGHGTRTHAIKNELKRRRDHTVTDESLMKMLVRVVGRCVLPEVQRAFSYSATRFEGFKIVRYDSAAGGFFRPHRDNLSPATAHRRFAMSLNLNESYEGGELCFPEYGPIRYRPAAGEALLFSGSLLHEVTEVTSGERLALLSFLFREPDLRSITSPSAAKPRLA
jgi:predicted 2-oxoglutarate/Fe(II)-dependent dioxygenase YbiX